MLAWEDEAGYHRMQTSNDHTTPDICFSLS
jgi:hypothetical protein